MPLGSARKSPRILGIFAAGLMVATALTAGVSVLPSSPVHAQQELQAAPIDPSRGFADLVDRVMPAVVSVQVKFANVAATGQQGGLQVPGMPENSPFGDFFRQFPQNRPGPGMPDQGQRPEGSAVGSGFIITADGYAVTNNHVVKDASEVSVKMTDGKEYDADVIGTDPKTDLALIKIKSDTKFDYVPFTDIAPRVGDWVVAVGYGANA